MSIRQYNHRPSFKDAIAEMRRRAEIATGTSAQVYAKALIGAQRMGLDISVPQGIPVGYRVGPLNTVEKINLNPKPEPEPRRKLVPVSIDSLLDAEKASGDPVPELGLPAPGPVAGEDDPEELELDDAQSDAEIEVEEVEEVGAE